MRTLLAAALLTTTLLPAVAAAAAPDPAPPKASLSLARDMEEVWHVGVLAIDKWPGLQHFNIRPGPPETNRPELDFDLSSHILSDTGSGLQETADGICQIGNDLKYDWHYTWTVEIMGHDSRDPQAAPEVATCTIGSDGVSKYR